MRTNGMHPDVFRPLLHLTCTWHICQYFERSGCLSFNEYLLQARSSVFRSMLASGMQEGETGVVSIHDMQPDVFRALLYFIYTDELPDMLCDGNMSISMAQHLLMASDRYQLERLRAICEKRLVDTVDIETVSTTLMLADKCNADNLRQVCRPAMAHSVVSPIAPIAYIHTLNPARE
jgi:speckle-type POZ protein